MENTRRRGGVHEKLPEKDKYTKKQLVDMKTQDVGYLVHKKSVESKKIEKLSNSLHFIKEIPREKLSKHTIFVDTEEEVESFRPEKYFDTPKAFLTRAYNRPTHQTLSETYLQPSSSSGVPDQVDKRLARERGYTYKELNNRINREKALVQAIYKMNIEKQLLLTNGNVNKRKRSQGPLYTWKKQRTK